MWPFRPIVKILHYFAFFFHSKLCSLRVSSRPLIVWPLKETTTVFIVTFVHTISPLCKSASVEFPLKETSIWAIQGFPGGKNDIVYLTCYPCDCWAELKNNNKKKVNSKSFFLTISCLTQKYWLGNATKWEKKKRRWGRKSPFKWDAFISAWPLKRGEGSCHSKEGKGYSATPPPPTSLLFLSHPAPRPQLWTTLTHTLTHHHHYPIYTCTQIFSCFRLVFLVVVVVVAAGRIRGESRGVVGCTD